MERYARGDDAAFADVYDALAPRLYGFLRRRTRDSGAAEDLVQQTLLHIHRARGSFIPGAEVLPWAFCIARRLMIDLVRQNRRNPAFVLDDHPSARVAAVVAADCAEQTLQARELADRLSSELARLPEAQREAFTLLKQDGLSLQEAADVLGVTVTAVKLRAHRAYEALRAVLGEELVEGAVE
jgi:RNA polymerase sigma-70 factor (ECF subfamily)